MRIDRSGHSEQNGRTTGTDRSNGVTDWTDHQAGVFIGAATGAFCPQFEYKIG